MLAQLLSLRDVAEGLPSDAYLLVAVLSTAAFAFLGGFWVGRLHALAHPPKGSGPPPTPTERHNSVDGTDLNR